jgi:hypothetical protein
VLHFPHIAGLTEGLSVFALINSSAHHWNDVVKHEVFRAIAPETFCVCPFLPLKWSEAKAVTLFFPRFVSRRIVGQHFVSIGAPSFFEGRTTSRSLLCGWLPSFWGTSLLSWTRSCTLRSKDMLYRFLVMSLAPKWIVRASHGFTDTLSFPASNSNASADMRLLSVNHRAADFAREFLTASWSSFRHDSFVLIG